MRPHASAIVVSALFLAPTACTPGADTGAEGVAPDDPSCAPAEAPFGTDAQAGESFPDLQLADCNGARQSLDAIRCDTDVTLLSFGAGWCAPCRQEAPALEAASRALEGRARVVQVLFQDGTALPATTQFCSNWTSELGLSIPVYIDPVQRSLDHFDVNGTPLNVLLDRNGRVLWADTGLLEDVQGTIEAHL